MPVSVPTDGGLAVKLYKFRPLATCQDLERVQGILETGQFWCSKFWELNDPMEGVYQFQSDTVSAEGIRQLFNDKAGKVICSFFGRGALRKPLLWCHYANGFKGVAIEVEVDTALMRKVRYDDRLFKVQGKEPGISDVMSVLTVKLKAWKHEQEYRFIGEGESGLRQIGTIKAVYFGLPYSNTVNAAIVREKEHMRDYLRRVDSLKRTAREKEIECRDVEASMFRIARASSGIRGTNGRTK
jgi:hypothetical protein